ncbi:hypothetical protein J9874_00710 [Duffyella gerundensis]|uniref:nuclear transport factor 2 family protein n=1 Tax=Duffyella gerundensis TaxID=1619313 RepID=UPI001CE333FE|nr:nuclear transport factor 2 family protein [Duffyella gerundensis]UCB30193.1 hypothetical protein J9874_00710 [Duffyella gerundensis]
MTDNVTPRPPLPPFSRQSAAEKVRLAEDGWNSRDAGRVALAYSLDTRWRNRAEFVTSRAEAEAFLTRKWHKELDYRLIKELWAFDSRRIAVRYAYEWRDDAGNWFRSYGNENWEFNDEGLMTHRYASINDLPIREQDRLFHWPQGRRPDDHPTLSELGL